MVRHVEATAFSSLPERDAAYAFILQEIAASEDVVRSWKRRYNELSLISRLPAELLGTIFKFVRESHVAYDSDLKWIRLVSHVCSHWRNVALECPSLWSQLPLRIPRWNEEMLVRSKMAPLTVQLQGSYWSGSTTLLNNLKAAAAQLPRIAELSLHSLTESLTSPFQLALLSNPAPLLASLTINSCRSFVFSVDVLQHLPLLRNLDLRDCHFSCWESPSLNDLQKLSITLLNVEENAPSVSKVLSTLCRMSQLETLELSFKDARSELDEQCSMTAFLPRLRFLKLTCDPQYCAMLLSHIHFSNPDNISLKPSPFGRGDVAFDLRRITETLDLQLAKQWHIQTLNINHHQAIIDAIPRDDITGVQGIHSPTIEIHFPYPSVEPFDLSGVIEPLSLQYLKFLTVLDDSSLLVASEKRWLDIFGDLPWLDTISVGASGGFIEALKCTAIPATERIDASEKYNIKFRALRSLCIDNWLLNERWHHGERSTKSWVQRLTASLASRKRGNMQLKSLVLHRCRNATEKSVASLKKVVEEVEWDGLERFERIRRPNR